MKLDQLRIPSLSPLGGVNHLYGLNDLIEEHFDKSTHVCEIGSYCGVSTSLFAETCGKVTAIDKRKLPCLDGVIEKYSNLTFLHMKSDEAVSMFEDGIFDAVYIDSVHTHEWVKKDIKTWLPKIKKGGIICGHDYVTDEIAAIPITDFEWCSKKMGFGGVKKAVDEIFSDIKTYKDASWAVQL